MLTRLACIFLLLSAALAQVAPSPSGGIPAGPTSVIAGQIQTPTGGVIPDGTLTFTLSQAAVVSGTAVVVPSISSCYTSNQGNIVGLPDPILAPVVSVNTATGTLASGTYYIKIYYFNSNGPVSALSPETTALLSSQGSLIVNAPTLQPPSASGFGIAISTTSGAETIQGTITGWTQFTQSTPLSAGATPAAQNNSVCNLYLSDQMEPTGTNYSVNLLNRNGSQVAGFPQSWCTYGGAGATINVSQGAPTGNCNVNGVYYPTPIFANTPGLGVGTQSIAGTVNFTQATNHTSGLNSTGMISVANPGVFTNTQMNEYLQSTINNCSPASLFQEVQGSKFATEGLSGCVNIPATSSVFQVNGVAGYIAAPASHSGVGGYFTGVAEGDNTSVWGTNTVAIDWGFPPTTGGRSLISHEADTQPGYASTNYVNVTGVASNLFGPVAGNYGNAFSASAAMTGKWVNDYFCNNGSAGGSCLSVGAQGAATNSSGNFASLPVQVSSNYWTGSASAADVYQIATLIGSGSPPTTSSLKISHSSGLASGFGLNLGIPMTAYNGLSTAGNGIPAILGATSQKGETGSADTGVLSLTPPTAAGTYRVCFTASVSAATSGVIGWTLSYADSNGNVQSQVGQSLFQQGTAAPALTFTTSAAGNYQSCSQIDISNAGSSIIVGWVGGGTTTAKVSATIERII